MTFTELMLFFILLGFLPWRISHYVKGYRKRYQICWQIYAIFWQLTLALTPQGHSSLRFTVPLIQRLSTTIWSSLDKLTEK